MMIPMFERIVSSHVGSFPLKHSRENIVRSFRDMVNIGIDIPPFPQMRSFIEMYLKPLENAKLIKVTDQRYLTSEEVLLNAKIAEIEIEEATIISKEAKKFDIQILRAPITGPFSLASSIYLTKGESLSATALARKNIVLTFFKEYVKSIVKKMVSLNYKFIVIDDPMLANVIGKRIILYGYSEEEIIDLYNEIFKEAADRITGIHVCGRLSPKLVNILAQISKLNVLNHEFKDSPENMAVFSKGLLEKYNKILSPGIVSSRNLEIESFEETYGLLRNLISKFGDRVNIVTADCGFKALKMPNISYEKAYGVAIRKLKLIVEAVSKANKELAPV